MLPDDVAHYLEEIGRVMKPGGRTMITWFLLNDEVERLLEEQKDRRHDPASNATTRCCRMTSAPTARPTRGCPST